MKYLKVMFKAKSGASDFEYKIGEVNSKQHYVITGKTAAELI